MNSAIGQMKLLIFFFMVCVVFTVSCGGKKRGEGKLEPTFSSIRAKVFEKHCLRSGCHAEGNAESGLELAGDKAYQNLVNHKSTQIPELFLVYPEHPDSSYLVRKLEGIKVVGETMPMGEKMLGKDTLKVIEDWIRRGAPRN